MTVFSDTVVDLIRQGVPESRIAAQYRVDRRTIRAIRRENNLPDPPLGPPPKVSRAEIVALLNEGRPNGEIARTLHVTRNRVKAIRREEGLPQWTRRVPTAEEKWKAWVRPVAAGHARWAGPLRGGTPNVSEGRRNYSARAFGFTLLHGRDPVGRVLPGCGLTWCVAPEHATDGRLRRADRLHEQIFGRAA